MYTVYKFVYIQYILWRPIMSTSSVVIHFTGWGCQSSKPQEICIFKMGILGSIGAIPICAAFFILERNPGVKRDLPAFRTISDEIHTKFGLDKYAQIVLKDGKLIHFQNSIVDINRGMQGNKKNWRFKTSKNERKTEEGIHQEIKNDAEIPNGMARIKLQQLEH